MADTLSICLPNGAAFTAQPGENLLTAAQRSHWLIRYGCRNGNCEVCEAQLLRGAVVQRDIEINANHTEQKILLCQCTALTDLTLAFEFDPRPGSVAQSRRFYAQLIRINDSNPECLLEFALPAGRKPPLLHGEYASVETETAPLQFNIAIALSNARTLILSGRATTDLVVSKYYYVRYPLGAGIEP